MKVCFVGDIQEGSLQRAEAFIKCNPTYDYTYVIMGHFKDPAYSLPFDVKFENESNFVFSDYDLVLNMNDKFFRVIIENVAPYLPNFSDKKTLSEYGAKFGFNVPKISDFQNTDGVIIKPVVSSGGYSPEMFCYRKLSYATAKALAKPIENYLIQEFIDSNFTLQFCVISDGKTPRIYDIILLEFQTDRDGRVMVVYGESNPE